MKLRYFRHPSWTPGDLETRPTLKLSGARGYRIAPYLDAWDWMYAGVSKSQERSDSALEQELVSSYLPIATRCLLFEQLAADDRLRAKQILLLHANQLEADISVN